MDEATSIDAETLEEIFEGMTVTVMASSSLRRELALLHAVLRPRAGAGVRARFPQPWRTIWAATLALQLALPPVPPDSGADVAHVRELLPHRQKALLAQLAAYAWRTLRAHPRQRLWLVPAMYSLRMPMLLEHQLLAAFVRPVRVPPWIGKPPPQRAD